MEKQTPKLAAIYARVSGELQKQEATIESQIDAIQSYAKTKNYEIVKEWIFKDEAESGKYLDRPGLDSLRDLAMNGEPDVIIMYEPDRIARKNAYQVILLEEFQKLGVPVEFVKIKPVESPEDQLTLNVLGAFAEYERCKIADRCRRGRLYKAKMGKLSIIPTPPYGYIKRDNTYEIDSEKSKIVKDIFSLYTHEQYSLSTLCNYLDTKQIPSPRNGKRWERTTLRDILKNETYIGTAYFGKTEMCEGTPNRVTRRNGKKFIYSRHARKERPRDLWIPMPVPGFINEKDFYAAQELLKTNQTFSSRNTKKPSLLQGLLKCQKCDRSFYKKSRGKTSYYCCNSMLQKDVPKCGTRSINQNELDAMIWDEVIVLLKDPARLQEEIDRRIVENKQNEVKHLQQEKIEKTLSQLSKAKDKLLDAYQESDCLSLDELRSRMEKIRIKAQNLEVELKTVKALKSQQEKDIDVKASLEYIENRLIASSTELSIEERQKVVRLLVEEVVISDDAIKIMHCVPSRDKKNEMCQLRGLCVIKA